ncbi:hypothetical protein D3C72_1631130 [compost metagenome]
MSPSSRQVARWMRRALQSAPTERTSRVTRAAITTPTIWPVMLLMKLTRSALAVSCIASVPDTPNTSAIAAMKCVGRGRYRPSTRNSGAQTSASMPKSCTVGMSTST